MRLNRSENTKRNIIIGMTDKLTGVLLPFAVRTMLLHKMGAEYLGLTGLFYSILQALNLAEMGFGTAIVYHMYRPIAHNDKAMINALLSFYRKVYRAVGAAVAVMGLSVMPFLHLLIRGDVPADICIYALYLIYLTNTCIGFFVFPERKALLTAHQREDIGGRVHIVTQFLMYAAQGASICLTKNYYLYAAMMPGASLLYSLWCARRTKKKYPEYTGGGKIEPGQEKEIRRQVVGLTIRKLAVTSRNALDSVFVSAFLGLGATAVYGNYYYIMDSVVMLLAVVRTSMAGGVGNGIALDSREKNLGTMHQINFLFMWISGWCSICLLCLYQPFMRMWAGEEMMLPFGIAVLLAVYFYVLKMGDIRTLYAESAGIWWQARYISVAEAGTNLVLNWVLVRAMGLAGIILATLISYLVFNFFGGAVILFRYYFTQGGLAKYFGAQGRYAAVTGIVAVITYMAVMAVSRVVMSGILGFVVKAAVCAVLPNLLYGCIYGKTKDVKDSRHLIEGLLKMR